MKTVEENCNPSPYANVLIKLSFTTNDNTQEDMHTLTKVFLALLVASTCMCSFAENRYSYSVAIQCGSNNSVTNNEYFYASTDMEAKNEVMRILNNNTSYRGRGCKLIELTSNKPQPKISETKTYEVQIQCGNSSSGSTQYFSADSDLEAENEARRILNNNTAFRGKNCQVTEMNRS